MRLRNQYAEIKVLKRKFRGPFAIAFFLFLLLMVEAVLLKEVAKYAWDKGYEAGFSNGYNSQPKKEPTGAFLPKGDTDEDSWLTSVYS